MQDDTVSAAAVVLAAAARSSTGLLPHHHQQQVDDHGGAATKTRWWSRLKAKLLCFRPAPHAHGHPRRIVAYASPESAQSSSTSYHAQYATRPAVAFVAPPSSPASSLLTSGTPSPMQVNAMSTYSSPTASIFAVGPYAREPQHLVSPPAFSASAGLTEPSTAPFTPPPESASGVQPGLSSPEVPFARFLSPPFQAYDQLQPGSPIFGGVLLSPVSTSSSPPPAWMHRLGDEAGSPPSGEFVFGRAAADEWTTFADGEHGGRRSSGSMIVDDASEDGGNQQWPFRSSLPKCRLGRPAVKAYLQKYQSSPAKVPDIFGNSSV